MDFGSLERAAWGRGATARTYAELFSEVTALAAPALLSAAGANAGDRVLDIACGPGTVSAQLAAIGARPVSLDLSGAMLRLARDRLPEGVPLVRANALRLPLREGSMDGVVCNFGILHFPQPELAFNEGARVLRPGGHAAWSVWGPDATLLRIIPDSMEALGLRPVLPPAPGFFRFAEPEIFENDLRSAGFTPLPTRTFRFLAKVASEDLFWRMFKDGTARTAAGIASLTGAQQSELRREASRRLEPWRRGIAFEIPASAVIGRGRRD
jgi:SAM-dependent methyltransferase